MTRSVPGIGKVSELLLRKCQCVGFGGFFGFFLAFCVRGTDVGLERFEIAGFLTREREGLSGDLLDEEEVVCNCSNR